MNAKTKMTARLVAILLVFSFAVSIPTSFSGVQQAEAVNRYYYKTVTSKTYTKTYYNIPDTNKNKKFAVDVAKEIIGRVKVGGVPLGIIITVYDFGNKLYDMDAPGRLTYSYYYKTKYKYDRLGKMKPKVVDKKMYVTLRLYTKNSKGKYSLYNTRKHTLHVKGGAK